MNQDQKIMEEKVMYILAEFDLGHIDMIQAGRKILSLLDESREAAF
jgi:hypothetical protein